MVRKELPQIMTVLRNRRVLVWLCVIVLSSLWIGITILAYTLTGRGGVMDHNLGGPESLRGGLAQARFRQIAFPALDALVAFVSEGGATRKEIKATVDAAGEGHWYPVPGGWRVKCPYTGQEFDDKLFTVETGGWDHGHCDICSATINAGQSCRAGDDEDHSIICDTCFAGLKRD